MNRATFDTLSEKLIAKAKSIRDKKSSDYASNEDVLATFDEISRELGIKREQVLAVLLRKHLHAITTYVKTGHLGSEQIDERICDTINFLLYLNAMAHENKGEVFKAENSTDKAVKADIASAIARVGKIHCPKCSGLGFLMSYPLTNEPGTPRKYTCEACMGTGTI